MLPSRSSRSVPVVWLLTRRFKIISSFILVAEHPRTVPVPVLVVDTALVLIELLVLVVLPSAAPSGWPQVLVWAAGVCLPLVSVVLMLNMPMRDPLLDRSGIGKPFAEPSFNVRSPEDVITLWQWMTVSWLAPLIKIGYKRQLHNEDVWSLAYEFQHGRLHVLFRDLSGTVLTRLLKANGLDLVITTCLGVLETSIDLVEPILLKQLLGALNSGQPNVRAAIVYAGITLFNRLVRAQSGVFSTWFQRRSYERSRGELITMIHEKTLRRKAFTFPGDHGSPQEPAEPPTSEGISTSTTLTDNGSSNGDDANSTSSSTEPDSRLQKLKRLVRRGYTMLNPPEREPAPAAPSPPGGPASTGKILNLLRNDAYEVAQRFWEAANLTTKPLILVVSLVLLWRILGLASLSGMLVLLACMAINVLLTRVLLHIERVRRDITDTRLQRTSQFVESIRHLRWYDWQDAWLAKIMESRHAELKRRVQSNIALNVISAVNNLGAYLFPVVGFWAYTLLGKRPLTVDVAFPALNLFSMLQTNLRELPELVTVLLNARVALGRIEAFMLEPEKEDLDADLGNGQALEGPPGDLEIVMRDASFSWPGSDKKVLRDVSARFGPGLTMVCGKVGIGKTALLQAILGELDQHGGERTVPREMIGYCAQTPWLESMSIRENVLFSAVYDKARFEQVIDACCLRDDLDRFRSKDLTLLGENGVGLSGGQRARVALARAIYSQARILLLDDPIAALDHHTATGIVQNLFADKNSPLTAGRLIILVTHRVDIVTPFAYQVVEVVDRGHVAAFDRKELENNEEELEHLAEIANTVAPQPDAETQPVPDKFIEDERRVHGGVLASVYWQYVKAGKLRWWATLIGLFILFRAVRVTYFWFLKEWGEQYTRGHGSIYNLRAGLGDDADQLQHATPSQNIFQWGASSRNKSWLDLGHYLPRPDTDVRPWILWFLILSLAQVFTSSMSDTALLIIVYKAARSLFEDAMRRVSNATFRFYDVTPVGRLMNRLTSDMGAVDSQIAAKLMNVTWYSVGWLSSVAVISTATTPFLVISITMTGVFVLIFNRFLPSSQSLRRLETVSLSPLMSNFGTLVEGLTTVRAFRAEPHFQDRVIATTDSFQKMDHFFWSLQAWLQYRFDLISALSTFTLTLTAIVSGLSSGTVGFVLASAANFVKSTHSLCRKYGDLQMQFVSVERVIELLSLEQEPRGSVVPPAAWPVYGDDIVFDNVTLRYAPGLDPVLHNVSLTIPGGANVAVTGRTGSGKSTLALSLLGTLHPDLGTGGSIRIGAVDLSDVDKHALRRNITFVAQDPVLFPGTLRDNLDPLGEGDEVERAVVLERVLGRSGSFTLDSRVDGGGKNLSQGQRQLVGLGRAMLRRSPVVIMDEATASIDADTAAYIHRLLREELRQSTVITIAHKAEAVADADFEVVLDKGRVVRSQRIHRS